MDILHFTEIPLKDESIKQYEYHKYEPITTTDSNTPGEIRINIEAQDILTHSSVSYLIFKGKLRKQDGEPYKDDNSITLTNNGSMHLFSNIKYQLSGQEIESLCRPGQATTMLGALKYPNDFSKSQGLNQCWHKDNDAMPGTPNTGYEARHKYIIKIPDPKGTFNFRVPLKYIFGFCEDYDKIVYGLKQTLALVRKLDDDAIFMDSATDDGKVTLEKVSCFMPHVLPADEYKLELYKKIKAKSSIPVMYRMRQCDSTSVPQSMIFSWRLSVKSSLEKPQYIIIAFRTEKDGNQKKNASIFNHINVKNLYIMLNST